MKRWLVIAAALVALSSVSRAHADEPSTPPTPPPRTDPIDERYTFRQSYAHITPAWLLTQLIPSPEIAVGDHEDTGETRAAFGLRWQVTPVLWSWGVNRRLSGWRFIVVDPLARMSGSLALEETFEYIGGHVDKVLSRPGIKATLPLVQRGEYLAFSLGTSVYLYDTDPHLAHDVGLYTLWGMFGVQGTYAPDHEAIRTLFTLRIRYF